MIEPKKNVTEMDEYKPPTSGRKGLLRLDFNENTVGPSPKVLEALRNLRDEDIASYPEYSKLRATLAGYLGKPVEQVLTTNATDEAISVIMQTYVGKGDEVIIPMPTFAMFKFYAQVAAAKIIEVLYTQSFSFPTQKVLKKISPKTKLVILCNPNNPTGTSITRKDIIAILEKARNSIVMIDEAYNQFSGNSCLDLIDTYDNLIVTQTFSKAFGMGGLRLGYVVSNSANIASIGKALSPYSVNCAAVAAGIAALGDKDYITWYTKEIENGKRYVLEEFKKMKIKTVPSDANFFLAKFGSKTKEVVALLREKAVLVRDRSSDPMLDGYIRITIGTKNQMKQLVDALKNGK
ncbi:MAG TPA: histidinol-phosphate transaminase [Candidatus Nanoarchaeia archaeon]|nr:histidinol-phosphate transaminase [Candidatus Nanoarchaeia archaeon]